MKILYISKNGPSPVRFYRGEGVLHRLRKLDPSIQLVFPNPGQEIWVQLLGADMVYFQRSTFDNDVSLATQALDMNIPIWYDIDDDVFNLPPENPASQQMDAHRADNCKWFLLNSTIVTVSTKQMAWVVEEQGRPAAGIIVVPNALDDYAFTDYDEWNGKRSDNLVTWRGGVTHQGDMLAFRGEFEKFLDAASPKTKMLFIGYNPWFLAGNSRCSFQPYVEYYEFMVGFRRLSPKAHVVPLTDNPFNRAKSNLALIESVYAGAIPVVRDWEEWKWPGALTYSTVEGFSQTMKMAFETGQDDAKKLWEANIEHLKAHYLLSKVNETRLQIVKTLGSMS